MLVLTRKVGDVIAIGDNVKIIVMSIRGKQVRLGIQADRSTVVHREEVYQKIQQEIRAAMDNNPADARRAGDLFKSVNSPAVGQASGSAGTEAPPSALRLRGQSDDEDAAHASTSPPQRDEEPAERDQSREKKSSGVRIRKGRPGSSQG